MKITDESHLDHGLSQEVVDYLAERFADRDAFFIETLTLPEGLGSVPCGLYGPIMGDEPVAEDEVDYAVRGARPGKSRLVNRSSRRTRQLTVIAGPHEDESCVLYTAFGGPLTPREPTDPDLPEEERAESEAFWSEHALARLV